MNEQEGFYENLASYEANADCGKAPSLRSQLEPFLEHIVVGVAFLMLGRCILKEWNSSIIGFIGILKIGFGGFKILIGLVIYTLALYARLIKPEWRMHFTIQAAIQTERLIINEHLELNQQKSAIKRYECLVAKYPNEIQVKEELASLYIRQGAFADAGRCLFFKIDKSEEEKDCVDSYIESKENNASEILINAFEGMSLFCLDKKALPQFAYYLDEVDQKEEQGQLFYLTHKPVLDFLLSRRQQLSMALKERKTFVIEAIILLVTLIIYLLFKS